MVQGNIHGADSYFLEEVKFESPSLIKGASIRLDKITTDIDIYENIERPYLTGNIVFVDSIGFNDTVDINGGELITISFRRRDSDFSITKRFRILKTARSVRNNDNAEVVSLSLVEDIVYDSEAQHISRSFTGTTSTIMSKIVEEYLDKSLATLPDVRETGIKVIIPNLTPINALQYLKSRATTDKGFPYYIYSSLFTDHLHMADLGTIISQKEQFKFPFVYSQTRRDTASDSLIKDIFTIRGYDVANQDNLIGQMQQGHIGGTHMFFDPFVMKNTRVDFNVVDDVFAPLIKEDLIKPGQGSFMYSTGSKINGKPLHQASSKMKTRISASGSYFDGVNAVKSLDEEEVSTDHKKKIVSESLLYMIKKNPIRVVVPSHAFIEGDENNTIGRIVNLKFFSSDVNSSKTAKTLDRKKSGQYFIHNCRHILKKEKYEISMTCLKLSNLEEVD